MSNTISALSVTGVSKAYKRYPNKWLRAWEWVSRRITHEKTWVLRDISFTVRPGEAVGIIGVNGAGKSTLLKIITGTTQPTTGQVSKQGRVAAMLELGMGFHPDFTGRQNVFMAGQLLGLTQGEIAACMPDIEAFAEIGDYIDRPVRVYSSGMQVRLAFSVATAVRPDLLIVDEALSVGDAYFQHKSFSKIREFREQGTSLLIVSHDPGAIQSLCDRAIFLERGLIIKDGPPDEVMDFYNALIAERENTTVQIRKASDGRVQTSSGTGEARVERVELLNERGEIIEVANVGETVCLKLDIRINANLSDLVVGYIIKDRLGQQVFGTNTHHLGVDLKEVKSGELISLMFAFPANIGLGSYSVSTALHVADTHLAANYEWKDLALVFNIVNINRDSFIGVNWIPPKVEILR